MKSTAIFIFLLLILALGGCDGRQISDECRKLDRDWQRLLKEMEKSGRFTEPFLQNHKERAAVVWFSTHHMDNKTPEENRALCVQYQSIITAQRQHAQNIKNIPQDKLEELFRRPPLILTGKAQ